MKQTGRVWIAAEQGIVATLDAAQCGMLVDLHMQHSMSSHGAPHGND